MNADPPPVTQHIVVSQGPKDYRSCLVASYVLLLCCGLLAMVPALGMAVWFIGAPVLLVTFILGIIVLARGGTGAGILLMFCTLIAAPIGFVFLPLISTAWYAHSVEEAELARMEVAEEAMQAAEAKMAAEAEEAATVFEEFLRRSAEADQESKVE